MPGMALSLDRPGRQCAGGRVAVGLFGLCLFVLVTLIDAPQGNRFQGWPKWLFCGAAVVVAAAGVIADNRQLDRRAQSAASAGQRR